MSESRDGFFDGNTDEREQLHFEVKEAIVSEFIQEEWFAGCGLWREGILLTLPMPYYDSYYHSYHSYYKRIVTQNELALPYIDRAYLDWLWRNIFQRVVDMLRVKFDHDNTDGNREFDPYESLNISRLRPRPAWWFYRVSRGSLHADIFFSFDHSVNYHNTHMGIGGSAILNGRSPAGTVAAIVNSRGGNGEEVLLTNQHILQPCAYGDPVYDLMALPPHVLGHYRGGIMGNFLYNGRNHYVDAAITSKDRNVTATLGDIISVGRVQGASVAQDDMEVQKYGKTTGHTFGEVEQRYYTPSLSASGTQQNVIRVVSNETFQDTGDSGSLLVDMNNKAIGLLYARGDDTSVGLACHWGAVQNALNISI